MVLEEGRREEEGHMNQLYLIILATGANIERRVLYVQTYTASFLGRATINSGLLP